MDGKINSLSELYNKVKPALRTKMNELNRAGLDYISMDDIWTFNKDFKWRNGSGLTIASMVNDILNTENSEYDNYVKEKLKNR